MKTETAFAIFILTALFFLIMGWPGGAAFLVLAFFSLSMVYAALGFYIFSDKNLKTQNLALSIIGGIFLSLSLLGMIFKMMYWPGSKPMLLLGTITATIIVVATFILKKSENIDLKKYYRNMLVRSISVSSFCWLLLIVPTPAFITFVHQRDSEEARLRILVYENPGNDEYREQLNDYRFKKDMEYKEQSINR